MQVASAARESRNPGAQPPPSVTVESPASTIFTGGRGAPFNKETKVASERIISFMSVLPDESRTHLNVARLIELGGDQSESRIGGSQIRRRKHGVIEHVEGFHSDLQLQPLRESNGLQQ